MRLILPEQSTGSERLEAVDVSGELAQSGQSTAVSLHLECRVLRSHWSTSNQTRLSLVERFMLSIAIKNQVLSSLVLYGMRIGGFHAQKGYMEDANMP